MIIGRVISSKIKDAFRLVQFKAFGKSDTREYKVIHPFGMDGVAPKYTALLFVKTGEDGKLYVLGYLNTKNIEMNPGDVRMYSTNQDGSQLKFHFTLRNDGTCEMNGTGDNMMRYTPANDGFEELKRDFNNLVIKFNAHTHAGVTVGAGSTGTTSVPATSSAASIASSKINEIKTTP